ncbi:MAG: ATP-binding protein [Candidatus Krumholzibacteria bacterium]|nr:ATP-binding protein [Candidatus Krumholzibacteria bacterium]
MIKLENLYSFMESSFDYLLVIDGEERIIYASHLLKRDILAGDEPGEANLLKNFVTPPSLTSFRSAMAQARGKNRANAVLTRTGENAVSIPLKAGCGETDSGEVFLFFGNKLETLRKLQEWEKNERIKELSCLYDVAEWIEDSGSISEFFTELPRHLASGMLSPEEAIIYSTYQGIEYGQKPTSYNYISVRIVVGGQDKGEIRVGYYSEARQLLPEEQRMLDEIGRMLSLALERKELKERLIKKQSEEADFNRRLEELRGEIAKRTAELEEQKEKLSLVNSYIDTVKVDWEGSKTTLETIFKAIPDEVVLIDNHRKVIMTNRTDVLPGTYCYASFFNRERPCEDCRLARILSDKTPVSLMMKRDNQFLQVQALPIYSREHEVNGIMEFYRDVTLEKTYEQQLQQADKLASLGQLVSGIGHEINNPNQFIRGNIKILKQSLEDLLPIVEEYVKTHPDLRIAKLNYDFWRQHIMVLVDDMDHGSQRIKGIVEGLRTFARKDEGLLVDTIDINTLVEASTRLVHNEVHKRADIELDLGEGLPSFTGNAQKVEQVLVNLLVNASQAMHDDVRGLIKVRTRVEDSAVCIDVEDNGVGMNEKTQKQIFDPFFTTKRAKGGTGLGLAIVYRILEEHGGNISVKSKVGAGTTFTIRIPSKPASQAKAGSPPAKPGTQPQMKGK